MYESIYLINFYITALFIQCDICKNLESENKKVEIKLKTEIESLRETIAKLENSNKELQYQSQTLNTENSVLKKVCIFFFLPFTPPTIIFLFIQNIFNRIWINFKSR